MKAMLLASALAGCYTGSGPTPSTASGNVVPTTQASRSDVEAYLPADAVLIWYEAEPYVVAFASMPAGRCTEETERLSGGFTVVRPGGGRSQYVLGTFDRGLLTRCLLEHLRASNPEMQVTEYGDQTKFAFQHESHWIAWHARFLAIGDEQLAPSSPAPADERVAALRTMRGSEVAVWTALPLVQAILGVEAKHMMIQLDTFEMPQEWMRQVSGTITVQLGSAAAAAAAKAALASGKIAVLTDPKLVAALQGLPVEVVGATLRARLTNLTFSLGDLLAELDPAVRKMISPRP